jgi:hypothetical protein
LNVLKGLGIALMVCSGIAAIWFPETALLWRRFPMAYTFGESGRRQVEQQKRWGARSAAIWRRWWPAIAACFLLGLALTIFGSGGV